MILHAYVDAYVLCVCIVGHGYTTLPDDGLEPVRCLGPQAHYTGGISRDFTPRQEGQETSQPPPMIVIRDCKIVYIYTYIRGAYDKFSDFFRMGTFIDSTHLKL